MKIFKKSLLGLFLVVFLTAFSFADDFDLDLDLDYDLDIGETPLFTIEENDEEEAVKEIEKKPVRRKEQKQEKKPAKKPEKKYEDYDDYDSVKVKSDKSPHELYLGYGYPASFFTNLYSTLIYAPLPAPGTVASTPYTPFTKGNGAVQLGYNFYCTDLFSLGLLVTYESFRTDLAYLSVSGPVVISPDGMGPDPYGPGGMGPSGPMGPSVAPEIVAGFDEFLLTIQGVFKFQYGWEYVRLYHALDLGVALVQGHYMYEEKLNTFFAATLVPIGVKIGKEQGINFFLDVAIGSVPFVNAGLSYRF